MNKLKRAPRVLVAVLLATWLGTGAAIVRAQEEFTVLRAAAESVSASVVQIETTGGKERVGDVFLQVGPSTGVVVSSDGLIVTSGFSVVHDPTTILVRLADGTRVTAELLARDYSRNLVLLRCPGAAGLPVPCATPQSEIQVGQFAVAVGKVFDPAAVNSHVGIVSALDRVWGRAIQTDAKISPRNYGGPLVDLEGRVMGILVPISPQSEEQLAGFEWYDSGIGFAIPFEPLLERLSRWSTPEDLYPGKLGVTPKASDAFTEPVELAAVGRRGPAAAAGLMPGDQLLELGGRTIRRYPDLRHALGRFVAGDTVSGVVQRGDQTYAFEVTLAKEIEPFRIAALGILPAQASVAGDIPGVVLRDVLPGSPALSAGMQVNDRIESVGTETIADLDALATALAAYEPGESVEIGWMRGEQRLTQSLMLEELGAAMVPGDTTAALEGVVADLCETRELRLEAFAEPCDVVLPKALDVSKGIGLFVWLAEPGKHDAEKLRERWGLAAAAENVVVISPRAAGDRWARSDVERINGFIQRAIQEYAIDRRLTSIAGTGPGAPMSVLVATDTTRPVQGLALLGGGLPPGIALQENEPLRRLSMACWLRPDQAESQPAKAMAEQVGKAGIPFAIVSTPDPQDTDTTWEVIRWTMSLDRH